MKAPADSPFSLSFSRKVMLSTKICLIPRCSASRTRPRIPPCFGRRYGSIATDMSCRSYSQNLGAVCRCRWDAPAGGAACHRDREERDVGIVYQPKVLPLPQKSSSSDSSKFQCIRHRFRACVRNLLRCMILSMLMWQCMPMGLNITVWISVLKYIN